MTKSTTALLVLALGSSVIASSCGSPAASTSSAQVVSRPQIETSVPSLRWVPADADLIVVANSANRLLPWLSRAQQLSEKLGVELGLQLESFGQWQILLDGNSPLATALVSLEVDWQASAALFSEGTSITGIVPVVDAAADAQLEAQLVQAGATQSSHGALAVLSGEAHVDDSDPESASVQWSAVRLRGHWVLHLEFATETGTPSLAWLSSMIAVGQGEADAYGGSDQAKPILKRIANAAPMFWGSADNLVRALKDNPWIGCSSVLSQVQGALFHGNASAKGVDLEVEFLLSPAGSLSLGTLLQASPSDGMRMLSDNAGVAMSVNLDLAGAERLLRAQGCELAAEPIARLLRSIPWSPAPTSIHVAGSRFDPSSLSGDIALEIAMTDSGFLRSMLDNIPGRSWLESTKTIGGEKVKKLSVPTFSPLYYQLQDTSFRFSNQKSAMEMLVTGAPGPRDEIASLTVRPGRIPNLKTILEMALPPGFAEFTTAELSKLAQVSISVTLRSNILRLQISVAGK